MIRLKNLLKEIGEDKNSNIASLENEKEWKWPDVEHMFNMKFDRDGSIFVLKNPPIRVYKIKKGPFVLEEPEENHNDLDKSDLSSPIQPQGMSAFKQSKKIKKYEFSTFIKLINFFDTYKQD